MPVSALCLTTHCLDCPGAGCFPRLYQLLQVADPGALCFLVGSRLVDALAQFPASRAPNTLTFPPHWN